MLERMSQGGIYDHLGGGYARYSTDAEWLVPHFEKMLYDNAQLLELLAYAHAEKPDPLFAARAAETVGWMTRDMTAETVNDIAAFAASEDADSDGEEGRFYVWTDSEVDALLGADSPAFKAAYDVQPGGTWEGETILHRVTPPGDRQSEERLARCRAILFAARGQRIRPGRDDKVLADWNGLTIASLCRAGAVFGRPDWIERAAAAFDFIMEHMPGPDDRVQHAWRLGRITAAGLLDDQACMARAALALYEATGAPERLAQARTLAEVAETWFADADGSYYTTAHDAADVPFGPEGRPRTAADNATPNGNGIMAEVLARLYLLTSEPRWRSRAEAVLTAFSGLGDRLSAAPTLLAAADLLEDGATVVVAGPQGDRAAQTLLAAARSAPDPATCVLYAASPDAVPPGHPAHGKAQAAGQPAAYLCRAGICGLPITNPDDLVQALRHRRGAPS
jgi:uncharacterized protein YyaL (SSP411 family)